MLAEQCRQLGLDVDAPAPAGAAAGGARARGAGAGRPGSKAKPRDPAALDISSIHRRVRSLMLAKGERGGGEPPAASGDAGLPAGWEVRAWAGWPSRQQTWGCFWLLRGCGLAGLPTVNKFVLLLAAATPDGIVRCVSPAAR